MLWSSVSTSKAMEGFATVRDKVSAHTEIRCVADKYQLVDIGALGIKWGDLLLTIDAMQQMVELVGLIIRNAGFAWQPSAPGAFGPSVQQYRNTETHDQLPPASRRTHGR